MQSDEGSISPGLESKRIETELDEYSVKLIAVRHGQSQVNAQAEELGAPILCGQTDSPLTSKGAAQAELAADKLYAELGGDNWLQQSAAHPKSLPKIFCGPLTRARQTAQATSTLITARAQQMARVGLLTAQQATLVAAAVQPEVDERITEMNYGVYEQRPLAQLQQEQPEFARRWDGYKGQGIDFLHRFPEGESRSDVMLRVGSFLEDLPRRYAGRTVIMFSHLEAIAAAQTDLGLTPVVEGRAKISPDSIKNATPLALN